MEDQQKHTKMITKDFEHNFNNPFFIATVVDNNDPTFNYRVKVRLDILHDAIEDKNLPWAGRVDTAFMGMSDEGDLDHKIPEVGSKVLVIAVANDPNSLLYLGCLYKNTPQTPAGDRYLNTYGIYTKKGEFIGVEKIFLYSNVIFSDVTFWNTIGVSGGAVGIPKLPLCVCTLNSLIIF